MEMVNALLARMWMALFVSRRDERGDVPGWVLVTIMSAGMVMALWRFALPELRTMLDHALAQVR